jgi:hypothetical protein
MLFQVKTGAFEVIDSGVLHVIEDEVTILRLGDVSFSLIFEKNDDGKQAVAFEASDKKKCQTHSHKCARPFRLWNDKAISGWRQRRKRIVFDFCN